MDVTRTVKVGVNSLLRCLGYELTRYRKPSEAEPPRPVYPLDFAEMDIRVWDAVAPYTMTSMDRTFSLVRSVEHVVRHQIPGDFVECGVWRGGSAMAIAMTLVRLGETCRDLHLFDTYEDGWPAACEHDVTIFGQTPRDLEEKLQKEGTFAGEEWRVTENGVWEAMCRTGYPKQRIHMVKGRVEDTIPGQAPERIALLRLDTDFYSSTAHELEHLYPRLASGGPFVIDDYGLWKGARKAADEYFERNGIVMYLHRVDQWGAYAGVKP